MLWLYIVHLEEQLDCFDVVSEGRRAYLSPFNLFLLHLRKPKDAYECPIRFFLAPFGEGIGALFYQTLRPNKVKKFG